MTKHEILSMAKQAHRDVVTIDYPGHFGQLDAWTMCLLERFADLVAEKATEQANARQNASWALMCEKMVAAEREACAKVCDVPVEVDDWEVMGGSDGRELCNALAADIRARGQK
jgi:hypothetical protein